MPDHTTTNDADADENGGKKNGDTTKGSSQGGREDVPLIAAAAFLGGLAGALIGSAI